MQQRSQHLQVLFITVRYWYHIVPVPYRYRYRYAYRYYVPVLDTGIRLHGLTSNQAQSIALEESGRLRTLHSLETVSWTTLTSL